MSRLRRWVLALLVAPPAAWLLLEIVVRLVVSWPLAADFYGSISRPDVYDRQRRHGVQVATGRGWAHLGWVADPDGETYRVERLDPTGWVPAGRATYGSFLTREAGHYRVTAVPHAPVLPPRVLGEVDATPRPGSAPLHVPRIAGPWQTVFRPTRAGNYVNDHTIFRDAGGRWRLLGITGPGSGDYRQERRFASAVSDEFPPPAGMTETVAVADFGEIAWAPHVITAADTYYLFWSPHRLHRMRSTDGVTWSDQRVVMDAPFHPFFRDAMVLQVAEGQWLLYATARAGHFSRVDLYQSFDLGGWQYIGSALRTGPGSERNAIMASTESPFVVPYGDRYYLALTYNNDSFVWNTLLLAAGVWLDRASYNDTRVFHADNPYDFGTYNGARGAPTLLTRLTTHAPEFVHHPDTGAWYVTTAGWPWVATLTHGEVAVAPLAWDPAPTPGLP